jgi:hypothetical protein
MQVFAATTIKVIIGQRGMVKNVVEKFKSGHLSPSTHGNVPGKSGVAQTASAADSGRPGMGGGGRGMGRRCQSPSGTGSPRFQNTTGNASGTQERAQLQQQADELKKQMDAITPE